MTCLSLLSYRRFPPSGNHIKERGARELSVVLPHLAKLRELSLASTLLWQVSLASNGPLMNAAYTPNHFDH